MHYIKLSQKVEDDFTQTPNDLFYIRTLNPTDRLLLNFLMCHKPDWKMYNENTANQLGISKPTFYTSFKKLETKGFIKVSAGLIIVNVDMIHKIGEHFRYENIKVENKVVDEPVEVSEKVMIDNQSLIDATIKSHPAHFEKYQYSIINEVISMKIVDIINFQGSPNNDKESCMKMVQYFFKQTPEYIKIINNIN